MSLSKLLIFFFQIEILILICKKYKIKIIDLLKIAQIQWLMVNIDHVIYLIK